MNFLFREPSPQPNNTERAVEEKKFNSEQLKLLGERRAADWLHANIKESVTEESKKHDQELFEKMSSLGLSESDYDFFNKNYHQFNENFKEKMH